jgi:ClpP class serine protease
VQSKGKPVVVHGDMVASAAYYLACHADYILADNPISSAFGSVGVYVAYMDYREKMKKDGVKAEMVYAPQSTLKNHEYREIMENDNKEPLIDNILFPAADRFITTVQKMRSGKIKEDSDVYKGKLYEGKDIVKHGLADGFGNMAQAIKIAASLAQLKKK